MIAKDQDTYPDPDPDIDVLATTPDPDTPPEPVAYEAVQWKTAGHNASSATMVEGREEEEDVTERGKCLPLSSKTASEKGMCLIRF